ncbi:preprotein translocase subunit YajC [Microlunatus sp. GCM10028923]|uniref:preprotein translocase subunit YajC n=1 Tax=Microlunatus sp. GCM10028923 TaxID=3273400 RepID=UPI00361B7C20
MTIVLIGLMVVAFYFLMIRPQRKRQQKQQETLNALQPGTRVLLGSGVFGTILRIGDKQAVLELSPGNELTVLKQAIVRVAGPEDEDNPETVNSTVPEPEEPASTLDLKDDADADAAKPEADEPGEQTWREYSIKQDDDADEASADQPATDQPASEQPSDKASPKE